MAQAQPRIYLESSAFAHKGAIPPLYTCEGQNVSPPLRWHRAPNGTKSWALIVDDPDAPDPSAPQRIWVHWIVYNIPPEQTSLTEGLKGLEGQLDLGLNDWQNQKWEGPCPPRGNHRYFYKLYALDTKLQFSKPPTKTDLEREMKGHILAQTELIGTYQKSGSAKK